MMSSKKITTAMILGAGFGTRLKPLTDDTPKVLIKVAGVPMLMRIVDQLKLIGINKVIINTHYLPDKVAKFASGIDGIKIVLSHEPVILGTGGGILQAMQLYHVNEMLIINCDCLLYAPNNIQPLNQLLEAWDAKTMSVLALLHDKLKLSLSIEKGDFNLDENQQLIYVTAYEKRYIFLGAYILSRKIFKGREPVFFPITDIIQSIDSSLLFFKGVINQHQWFDTGNHECLAIADRFFNEH